jgi:hypothetical protein
MLPAPPLGPPPPVGPPGTLPPPPFGPPPPVGAPVPGAVEVAPPEGAVVTVVLAGVGVVLLGDLLLLSPQPTASTRMAAPPNTANVVLA